MLSDALRKLLTIAGKSSEDMDLRFFRYSSETVIRLRRFDLTGNFAVERRARLIWTRNGPHSLFCG